MLYVAIDTPQKCSNISKYLDCIDLSLTYHSNKNYQHEKNPSDCEGVQV